MCAHSNSSRPDCSQAGPDGGRIARFFGDGKKNLRAWVKLVSAEERTVELTIATLEEVSSSRHCPSSPVPSHPIEVSRRLLPA
eukprot:scaffold49796_cov33-Tisochrysis_lutea.AAC.2